MKKLGLLLGVLMLFQTGYSEEKSNVNLFSKDGLFLNHLTIIAAAGLTNECGAPSYEAAFGGIIGIETILLRLHINSVIKSGFNLSLQRANYTESNETDFFGYRLKSALANGNELSGMVSLIYLKIPVFYHYQSNIGIYGEVGIQPGLLLSAKDKFEGESYDFNESSKTFKLGLPLGAGYSINDKISIGARAVIGILDNIEEEDYFGTSVKSKEFMLMGIIKIRLNSK